MSDYTIHTGDVLDVLPMLESGSINCCVTSPPYFGLRDYGHAGQIGLEPTPDEYVAKLVAVFREVKRVLRDDGTLWLNLGDSYAAQRGGTHQPAETLAGGSHGKTDNGGRVNRDRHDGYNPTRNASAIGMKHKDLIGIPWRVAFALQQPYYAGNIKDERDRVWLAAMVDAEGSICGTEYTTGDRTKTNLFISITNTSVPIIEKCERLFPQDVKHVYEKAGPSSRTCYRWDVERMETKALFIREIYPYLVAKRKHAVVAYTFLEMQRGLPSKKKGYVPEQHDQRSWLMAALSRLNAGEDIDLPEWVVEPPSLFEPGFYLRQDIIWHKPNPMPESVRDRCTKAHEYIFLLSKSARYYYDQDAVKIPVKQDWGTRDRDGGKYHEEGTGLQPHTGLTATYKTANRRSVWTVTTKPFSEAHFAVFPPDLIRPCIRAGCPEGGIVLDPFNGSGTTGVVCMEENRNYTGIELNPEYVTMARRRISQAQPQWFGEAL